MDEIYRNWASVAIDEDSGDEVDGVDGVGPPGSVWGRMAVSGLPGSDSEGSEAGQIGGFAWWDEYQPKSRHEYDLIS